MNLLSFLFLVIVEPIPPEVDLGFIISAGSTDATATLRQIKDVIKSFIDKYSSDRLRYGIISYGSTPRIELTLRDSVNPDVTQLVDGILRPGGTPDLARALQRGEELLSSARPNVQKVLVIITDVKSGSSLSQVKLAVKSLDNKDILVFAVAIGSEVDPTELSTATGSSRNIINSSNTDEPEKVRGEIITKIIQGKRSVRCFCSACAFSQKNIHGYTFLSKIVAVAFHATATIKSSCLVSTNAYDYESAFLLKETKRSIMLRQTFRYFHLCKFKCAGSCCQELPEVDPNVVFNVIRSPQIFFFLFVISKASSRCRRCVCHQRHGE